ncbi:MAG TPA: TolC family protein [Deinococcales bacterium]|nr:TolC family protein [Deinococcales bacterium]
MKRTAMLLTLLLLTAQAAALDYGEALTAAASRPGAVSAQLELINAEADHLRTEGDPLALRNDRLEAQQELELAEAELEQARREAVTEITEAYFGVLSAREQLALARLGHELAETALEIAEIRVANGSATELDLRDARASLDEAAAGLRTAESGIRLAVSNLEGVLGRDIDADELEPVPDSWRPPVPALENVLESITGVPQYLEVEHGLELAGMAVDMLDPAYASEAQIESARTRLEATEQLIREARRGFQLQARNLHLQAEDAQSKLSVEEDLHANAVERHEFERQRLEGGLISDIEFRQSELDLLQAELALLSARSEALGSILELSAETLVPIAGPAELRGDQ